MRSLSNYLLPAALLVAGAGSISHAQTKTNAPTAPIVMYTPTSGGTSSEAYNGLRLIGKDREVSSAVKRFETFMKKEGMSYHPNEGFWLANGAMSPEKEKRINEEMGRLNALQKKFDDMSTKNETFVYPGFDKAYEGIKHSTSLNERNTRRLAAAINLDSALKEAGIKRTGDGFVKEGTRKLDEKEQERIHSLISIVLGIDKQNNSKH